MADKITSGSWSARWGNWMVGLRQCGASWLVTVWRWKPGTSLSARHQLAERDDFESPVAGVIWACDVLRNDSAKVFVIGMPSLTLDKVLQFSPAPEAVA